MLQCNADDLQDYYVNLVRAHSHGKYVIVGARSEGADSPDNSDAEMDSVSNPPSPVFPVRRHTARSSETSYMASDGEEVPYRKPTIEQNMAFAALQRQQQLEKQDDPNDLNHRQ